LLDRLLVCGVSDEGVDDIDAEPLLTDDNVMSVSALVGRLFHSKYLL
jgi:hypothetical protein